MNLPATFQLESTTIFQRSRVSAYTIPVGEHFVPCRGYVNYDCDIYGVRVVDSHGVFGFTYETKRERDAKLAGVIAHQRKLNADTTLTTA